MQAAITGLTRRGRAPLAILSKRRTQAREPRCDVGGLDQEMTDAGAAEESIMGRQPCPTIFLARSKKKGEATGCERKQAAIAGFQ